MEKKLAQQLRKIQINILDAFVEICDKHRLKYWLDGGTLLGAVRHKGFIPWDDDIDVAMPLKDYNQFLKIAKKELHENIFLQTSKNDKGYRQCFSKLRDNNSTFIEINEEPTSNYHQGIYIDIFPMVSYPLLPVILLKFLVNIIEKTRYVVYVLNRKKSFKLKLAYWTTKTFWFIFSVVKGKYYANSPEDNGYNIVHDYSGLFPFVKVEFEGKKYNAPCNTSGYLTDLYGKDYLIPPTIEKQVTHALIVYPETPCQFINFRNNLK